MTRRGAVVEPKLRDEQERLKERFAEIIATVRDRMRERGLIPVAPAQDGRDEERAR